MLAKRASQAVQEYPRAEKSHGRRAGNPSAQLFVYDYGGERTWRVSKVEVTEDEYAHDVAEVTIDRAEGNTHLSRIKPSQPVRLSWGFVDGRTRTLYGYVSHVQQMPDGNDILKRVTVVGASARLKEPSARVWSGGTSVAYVLATVARFAYMRAVVSSNVVERLLDRDEVQTIDESEWEFLVRLAKRHNLTLYAKGARLWCYERAKSHQSWELRPIFFTEDQVLHVHPRDPRDLAGDPVSRAVTAWKVDPERKNLIKMTAKPQGRTSSHVLNKMPGSWTPQPLGVERFIKADSRSELEAELERSSWGIRASVRLEGHARVHQGSSVALPALGPDHPSGRWYVTAVRHVVTKDSYEMHCSLAREGSRPMGTVTRLVPTTVRSSLREGPNEGQAPALVWGIPPHSRPGSDLPEGRLDLIDPAGLTFSRESVQASGRQPHPAFPAEWRDRTAGLRGPLVLA